MQLLKNPLRGQGINAPADMADKQVSTDASKVLALLGHCPVARSTSLIDRPELAEESGVAKLYLKDERERMGLGSFKAAGAAYVIATAAAEVINADPDLSLDSITPEQLKQCLTGKTYICASAGNHGLSVAAGARVFGADAVIYLAHTVPDSFGERLESYGAEVVWAGDDYAASLDAAMARMEKEGWQLLADTSWPGYTDIPTQVMEGYLVVPAEACEQVGKDNPPTHIFLQAGVGGIAGAATAYMREFWGDGPVIGIVEPDAAPALIESVRAGKVIISEGPASEMGRLDCKEPSHVALNCISKQADWFITMSDAEVLETVGWLKERDIASTSSATAGVAVVQQSENGDAVRELLGLNADSRVLAIITEQA